MNTLKTMMNAMQRDDVKTVEREIEKCTQGQMTALYRVGHFNETTVLHAVLMYMPKPPLALIKKILDKGGMVNETDSLLRTALHVAIDRGHHHVVQELLKRKADPNGIDMAGYTPLLLAIYHRHPSTVRLLLQHGADIHMPDTYQQSTTCTWTPLHFAAHMGELEIVKILLEHGADMSIENDARCTPRELAEAQHHHEVIDVLKAHARKKKLPTAHSQWGEEPAIEEQTISDGKFLKLIKEVADKDVKKAAEAVFNQVKLARAHLAPRDAAIFTSILHHVAMGVRSAAKFAFEEFSQLLSRVAKRMDRRDKLMCAMVVFVGVMASRVGMTYLLATALSPLATTLAVVGLAFAASGALKKQPHLLWNSVKHVERKVQDVLNDRKTSRHNS